MYGEWPRRSTRKTHRLPWIRGEVTIYSVVWDCSAFGSRYRSSLTYPLRAVQHPRFSTYVQLCMEANRLTISCKMVLFPVCCEVQSSLCCKEFLVFPHRQRHVRLVSCRYKDHALVCFAIYATCMPRKAPPPSPYPISIKNTDPYIYICERCRLQSSTHQNGVFRGHDFVHD